MNQGLMGLEHKTWGWVINDRIFILEWTNPLSSTAVFNYMLYQHIIIISEVLCDTEDWINGCWKFSFAISGINYILKYFKIETFS